LVKKSMNEKVVCVLGGEIVHTNKIKPTQDG